jgi:hypothetical protein
MKKSFKMYAVIWAILLAVFNLVVFLVRPIIPGYVINYDARFWIAWVFIIVAFIGNLVCAYFAFKTENKQKLFYNLPLITISWAALIAMLVVGCVIMLIPNCPAWIAAVVCILILAFNAIAIVKASWAAGEVQRIDEKVKMQTSFIKNLTVDAEGLIARAKSDEVKRECKKVYEALRHSDPMSNDALSVIEAKITVIVDEFSSAVVADDLEKAKEIAGEIIILVADRNKKCKTLK